jgi:hypothetical protein
LPVVLGAVVAVGWLLAGCGGTPPTPPEPGGTSYQLIDAAVERGDIDAETALSYKVYATFGDERLPEEFAGDDAGRDGTTLMLELSRRIDSLSPAVQAELRPFLLPPAATGSWLEAANEVRGQQPTWGTVVTANDKVKVWYRYPGDEARATAIAAELDRHVWGTLTGLMREPLPDCGAGCPTGGGDPRIDIYLVHIARSYVQGEDGGGSSAYMVLDSNETFGTLAHEFMHVIQFAYPTAADDEYDWLFESTAQWAMDYVYPASNQDPDHPVTHEEHDVLGWFLDAPHVPLETTNDEHEYGAYLFSFYLAGEGRGGSGTIRSIWEHAANPSSLAAVDAAIAASGGFEEVWPRFTLHNWNREPVDDYQDWDSVAALPTNKATFGIGAPGEDHLDTDVPHLAAYYYQFSFTSESVRSVIVENPYFAGGDPHAHLWAIPKIGGAWKEPEDWSRRERKRYCRQQADEHIEELILIVSNSSPDPGHTLSGEKIDVESRALGCTCDALEDVASWTGSGGFTYQVVADDGLKRVEYAVGADATADLATSLFGGSGPLVGSASIERLDQSYDPQGALHFLSSIDGSGQPVPQPNIPDSSVLVLVIDPDLCRYTVGLRAYVDAVATDIVGATTDLVATVGSFSTAWLPISDDLTLVGGGSFPVHSSQFILDQDDLIDAFLLDDFTIRSILGEDGMGSAQVSWSLVAVPKE